MRNLLLQAQSLSNLDQRGKNQKQRRIATRAQVIEKMERETRIELATNSLEGCDSTIELLPLFFAFNHLQCTAMYVTGAEFAPR